MRILVGLLAACTGGGSGGDGTERVFENVGRMCVFAGSPASEPTPQSFVENGDLLIQVDLAGTCLSSSCDIDREMSCTVTDSSSGLVVTSRARWLDISAREQGCTDDCGLLSTTCEATLPSGAFVITFGDQPLTLTIPSDTAEQPCVEVE